MLHPRSNAALLALLFGLGAIACSATADDTSNADTTGDSADALRRRKKVAPASPAPSPNIDAGASASPPPSTSSIALAGSCWDSYACPVGSQRVWSAPVREGFELQGTKGHYLLVAHEDVAGASVGIDHLREWLKPGTVISVDDVERGVATTVGGTEDLYARATESPNGIALTVRIVPTWGSSYKNSDACTKPAVSSGGYCSFTQSP